MRNAIRNRLLAKVPVLEHIMQPGMADENTKKPYAVVKFGVESEANISGSFNRTVEIWIYTERQNYNTIDSIVSSCIQALNGIELTTNDGLIFELELTGISPDGFPDPDLKAFSKTISFTHGFIRK